MEIVYNKQMENELSIYHPKDKTEKDPEKERMLSKKLLEREFRLEVRTDSQEEANKTKLEILLSPYNSSFKLLS